MSEHSNNNKDKEKTGTKVNGSVLLSYLWRFNQMITPLILAWGTWVTVEVFQLKAFAEAGPRFTKVDANNLELQVKSWVRDNYPPSEMREDIKQIKEEITEIKIEIERLK